MKSRRWGVIVFENAHWVPMLSLGVHVDFHTPRLDLHLLVWTVAIGRIMWTGREVYELFPSVILAGGRFVYAPGGKWSGHTDDCWHKDAG